MSMDIKKMNIVFVESVVDKQSLELLPDASIAGNKMQLGFINGFINNNINTKVITVEPHGMWKFNKKPIIVKSRKQKIGKLEFDMISYINIPIIKQICIYCSIFNKLKKMHLDENTIIMTYNTMSIFALPVLKISKIKSCKCIAIVADLPILMRKNIVRRIEDKNQEKIIKKFDGIIPLTTNIAVDFAPSLPYCLIEAGYDPSDYLNIEHSIEGDKDSYMWNIVFSGTLNELSGIELIISAMDFIEDKNIILNIYGDGNLKNLVVASSKKNKNICYHGKVNNKIMMQIQAKADLLVCPRLTDNYTTRYTFPSKILEYLCVGVPIICNKLAGIPKEYDEYLHYPESESAEDWAKEIKKLLGNDYIKYKKKSKEATKKFIKTKTWDEQCKRILEFIRRV